tara:strand:+ start:763 stop:1059 length:297 start_codon:yes stop_codon:yes gene_type:complete
MNKKLDQNGINTSVNEAIATEIQIDEKNLWIKLADGRQLATPLVYFPRLLNASEEDLNNFELIGNGRGIHWKSLDEDISIRGLLLGSGDQTKLGQRPL